MFLQGVGVSTSLAVRIYKKYGDEAISVVRDEPYRLAADVWGIGFKTADTIAAAVGIARDSPERIKAGLAYTLSEAADEGHCYLPAPNLIADAAKILEVPAEMITPCLDELAAAEGVVREEVPAAAGPAPAEHGIAGARRLPAALLDGRTVPGLRPAPAACRAGRPAGGVRRGGLGQGAGLAARPHWRVAGPRAGRGGAARPHLAGGGADRRARVREELHGTFGRGAGPGQGGQGGAGRADRPGRQAAGRTDRARSGHHPPAAAAAAGRRALVRRRFAARRRPGGGGRDLDGGPDPGQQAGQGGTAGSAPAAGGGRGPAALGRRRRGAARPDRRGHAARGAADQDLPAGPAVRHRGERAPDQRGPAARDWPASPTSSGSPATSRRRPRRW